MRSNKSRIFIIWCNLSKSFGFFSMGRFSVICFTIGLPDQSGTSQTKHYSHFVQVKESVRNRKRCYWVIIPVPGAMRPATKW